MRYIKLSLLLSMLAISLISLASGCRFSNSMHSSIPIHFPWQRPTQEVQTVYSPNFSSFKSPQIQLSRLRRVVLVASGPSYGNYNESNKMIGELAAKLRANGLFDVITTNQVQQHSSIDTILQGRFDERELVRLSRQHNADAIGFVRVNELRGYAPMRTAITVAIVDCNESIVAYAADGNWDVAHLPTKNAFQQHVYESHAISGTAEIQLQSPRALMSFAAQQIADDIASTMR